MEVVQGYSSITVVQGYKYSTGLGGIGVQG
jgi:hypothetical protein